MTNSFVGKVVSSVQGAEEYSESICFTTECGEVWGMLRKLVTRWRVKNA